MSEHASDAEPGDGSGPRGRRFVLLALGLALVAAAAGLGAVFGSWPPPDPQPRALPSDSPTEAPASPAPVRRQPLELPDLRGRTVAEAASAAESAGATPVIFDARWNRPVAPDRVVCTDGEAFHFDTPPGELHIAAVPAGDPCP